jgi:hypothetical protein
MLNFFDAGVFGLMAQRIKVDFLAATTWVFWSDRPTSSSTCWWHSDGAPGGHLPKKDSAGVRDRRDRRDYRAGRTRAKLQAAASSRMLRAPGIAHAPGAYSMLADIFHR